MKSFLLVFLGGGLGSGLRYLVTITMNQYSKVLPFGTFTVNMLGCLLIGLILGYAQRENTLTSNQTLLLATGFCGGFTTFSAFANENLEQVLVWATNTSSVLSDYKLINEDNYSLCGFHSVTSRENPEKRTKMVYASLRNGKIAVYHCHEIIP